MVDPTNPKVFWTTQEYAVSADTWGTRVAAVGFAPRALDVSSTAGDGTYGVGTIIPITVAFDAAVTVTGPPKLHLNSGGDAVYTGGSGTSTLTFTYTVAAGQTTSGGRLDYTSTTPFDLTGATITDAASGIAATLTLPAPGTAGSLSGTFNFVIDTTVSAGGHGGELDGAERDVRVRGRHPDPGHVQPAGDGDRRCRSWP